MNTSTEKFSCQKNPSALFSIMIPSWNNLAYLQLCINSIRKHSFYPHEIIVHINEGKDGSLEWIKHRPILAILIAKKI